MDKPVFDAPRGDAKENPSKKQEKLVHWASNLEEHVDKQLIIMLRDNRKLVGWLRSFDQFANLVLEHAVERHVLESEKLYADVYLGTMVVRGENVCLFGELDPAAPDGPLRPAPLDYVLQKEAELEAAEVAAGVRRHTDAFADVEG
mmetsp:Transcript_37955/g.98220  ORF Transcript_37955/g.98220 Transcript_37955/m.98220 type:complete len:146 (+) Transcript_37955:129-566(+)|eukprot:CAMPEP_0195080522 /NCGR_PEP_ID=MMETSP0448-20130528/22207_1 /TAXON_ID=66468 /ORGANISM="Heterocapsa triquestra, Strain CCMP 448" /LENGTH=145 /DNA_ID=CAMNT_0040113475 /DNA_START=124 /DNA_END=561 /DNA_ORIENTATION=-